MRKYTRHIRLIAILLFAFGSALARPVAEIPKSAEEPIEELEDIGITEQLGLKVPPDITITNDKGEEVQLGSFYGNGKPTILILAYYQCPMLCNLVLNGMSESLDDLSWEPGEKYEILTVSIKPSETFELAAQKKVNYLSEYADRNGREFNPDAWTFAVAEESQSLRIANAVGFHYKLEPETGEYSHSAASFVLTDEGVISRYLYGISHEQHNLKLALLEAGEGEIGNTFEKIILYCYKYDPEAGGYVVFASNVMKLGGALFVVLLGLIIGGLWLRERSRSRPAMSTSGAQTGASA